MNPRRHLYCFVTNLNTTATDTSDLVIIGKDRNRAMNGDLVAIREHPREKWIVRSTFLKKVTEQKECDKSLIVEATLVKKTFNFFLNIF